MMLYRKDIPNEIWDKLGIYGTGAGKHDEKTDKQAVALRPDAGDYYFTDRLRRNTTGCT